MSVAIKTPPFPRMMLGPTPSAADLEVAREQLLDAFSRAPSGAGFDAMTSNLKAPPAPKKCKSSEVAKLPFEATLLVGTDGTLGIGKPPKKLADEMTAITTAAFANAELDGTKEQLEAIGARLLQLHAFCIRGYPTPFQNDALQARAAILELAQRVAAKAPDNEGLTLGLIKALSEEPHMRLREFGTSKLLKAHKAGKLPAADDYAKAVDQTSPPYDTWDNDGVIRIHYVVDNDGTPRESVVALLRSMKFKAEQREDGSTVFRRTATKPGVLPTEIILRPAPNPGERPPIFDKMADDDVDIVLYSGHAGYGQNVRDAVNNGVQATGEGKLILLYQCSGITNTEDIKKAFPLAQFSSTTTTTSDATDMPMFQELLRGFEDRKPWPEINAAVQARLKKDHPSDDYSKQYFYPGQAEVSETQMDRNGNGMPDVDDSVYSVTTRPMPTSIGVDAVEPIGPVQYLGAPALTEAIGNFTLVLRNNHFLTKEEEKRTPWTCNIVAANGFFHPEPGDDRAFTFTVKDDRLLIALSTHYAHADEQTLSRMLAMEAGQFFGAGAGLNAHTTAALSLAFLERLEHQTERRYGTRRNLANDLLFFQRYGGDADTRATIQALGNPDDLTRAMFVKLVAAGKTLKAPMSVGKALTVPTAKIDHNISPAMMGEVLSLKGTLSESNLIDVPKPDGPAYNRVYKLEHDGKTQLLLVSIDAEGWFIGARTYDLDPQVAVLSSLDPGAREVFLAARVAGKTVTEALQQALVIMVAARIRNNVADAPKFDNLALYMDPFVAPTVSYLEELQASFSQRNMWRALGDVENYLERVFPCEDAFESAELAQLSSVDLSKHTQAERAAAAVAFVHRTQSMERALELFGVSRIELLAADIACNKKPRQEAATFEAYMEIVDSEKDFMTAAKKLFRTLSERQEYPYATVSLTQHERTLIMA